MLVAVLKIDVIRCQANCIRMPFLNDEVDVVEDVSKDGHDVRVEPLTKEVAHDDNHHIDPNPCETRIVVLNVDAIRGQKT